MKKLIVFPLLLAILTLHAQKNDTASSGVITGIDTTIYSKVDTEAVFPGGKQGWINFVQKNLNPSTPVDNGAKKGKYIVWVKFIVTKDGHVKNITAETKKGYGLEEEVIRMMLLSPDWLPAKLNGKPVASYKRISQEFDVSEG
jgi:protein TonB